jgi:hypothetical protein
MNDAQGQDQAAKDQPGRYTAFMNCSTPEQVVQAARRWSSDVTDHEHLVRSTILEIDAGIEVLLKKILYEKLSELVWVDTLATDGEERAVEQRESLSKYVERMSFGAVHSMLKPCLEAFDKDQLAPIGDIRRLRNEVTHGIPDRANYKGRNPFRDSECLAQLFVESWVVREQLSELIMHRIDGARALHRQNAEFYDKHAARFRAETEGKDT